MKYVSTGCETLDKMMGGGLLSGATNLIYGDPGSGKTTLTMQTILNLILTHQEGNFYYLDTEKGYLEERTLAMANEVGVSPDEVSKRLKSYRSTSLVDQHKKIIHEWEEDIKKAKTQPLLFCIDSFVNHYHKDLLASPATFLASKARELQGRLAYQSGKLLDLADRYDAPVILVSWTKSSAARRFRERERKEMMKSGEMPDIELGLGAKRCEVIGGSHLEYISKTITRLMILEDDTRAAVLEKHIAMPVSKLVILRMTSRGLTPVDDEVHDLDGYYREITEAEKAKQGKTKSKLRRKNPRVSQR